MATRSGGEILYNRQGGGVPPNGLQIAGSALQDAGMQFMQFQMQKQQMEMEKERLKLMKQEQEIRQQAMQQQQAEQQMASTGLQAAMQQPDMMQMIQQTNPMLMAQMQQANAQANLPGLQMVPESARTPEFQRLAAESRAQGGAAAQAILPKVEGARRRGASLKAIDFAIQNVGAGLDPNDPNYAALTRQDAAGLKQLRAAVASSDDYDAAQLADQYVKAGLVSKGAADSIEMSSMMEDLKGKERDRRGDEIGTQILIKKGFLPEGTQPVGGAGRYAQNLDLLEREDRLARERIALQQKAEKETIDYRATKDAQVAAARAMSDAYVVQLQLVAQDPNIPPTERNAVAFSQAAASLRQQGYSEYVDKITASNAARTIQAYSEASLRMTGRIGRVLQERFQAQREPNNARVFGMELPGTSQGTTRPRPLKPEEIRSIETAVKKELRLVYNVEPWIIDQAWQDSKAAQYIDAYQTMTSNPRVWQQILEAGGGGAGMSWEDAFQFVEAQGLTQMRRGNKDAMKDVPFWTRVAAPAISLTQDGALSDAMTGGASRTPPLDPRYQRLPQAPAGDLQLGSF